MHHWWKDRDNSLEISDSQLGLRLSKAERFCIFHGKKPNTFISRIWHNFWRPGMDDKVWKLRNFSLALQIIYKNSINSSLAKYEWVQKENKVNEKKMVVQNGLLSSYTHSTDFTGFDWKVHRQWGKNSSNNYLIQACRMVQDRLMMVKLEFYNLNLSNKNI